MEDEASRHASAALEDAAFLARSDNRVRILAALREGPSDRRDLAEATGVSRATLGRILTELQSRGWAERSGDGYAATPAGERVTAEFEPFVGALAAVRRLGDAVAWLPDDELTIDLHHFRDAEVRRPERYDPMDTADFVTERLREATRWRVLTHLAPPEPKQRAMLEGVTSGRLDQLQVITDDLLAYLHERPERLRWYREYLEAGARSYVYDEPIPCNLFVVDDLVLIADTYRESGNPYAAIVSDDATVRAWVEDVIERYRADAEPVTPETIPGEPTVSADGGE